MPGFSNAAVHSLAIQVLSQALSGSGKGKRHLRQIEKLLGSRQSASAVSVKLADELMGAGAPSAPSAEVDLVQALLQTLLSGALNIQKRKTTVADSARSQEARKQADTMRLSEGQRAVLLAEIIRRAERNL